MLSMSSVSLRVFKAGMEPATNVVGGKTLSVVLGMKSSGFSAGGVPRPLPPPAGHPWHPGDLPWWEC